MKEKIINLAKEIFEYERPELSILEEELSLEIEMGKIYEGNFTIKNSWDIQMKGVVFSSSPLMQIVTNVFQGTQAVIAYRIFGEDLTVGDMIKGFINIISSAGEMEVPFQIQVELPFYMTSMGKIRDLFHFANLAKQNWPEALRLFKSNEFEQIFLYQKEKDKLVYQSLVKGSSPSQAMEEFLIGVHKKLRIAISVDKNVFQYGILEEKCMEKVTLLKDNWGYTEIRVSSDVNFIIPEHKIIWTDNFIGNQYILEFLIDTTKMKEGKNEGHITLKTIHQTLIISIEAMGKKKDSEQLERHQKVREYTIQFTRNYLNFRIHQISLDTYMEEAQRLLHHLNLLVEDKSLDLLATHFNIISGRIESAKAQLEELDFGEDSIKDDEIENYCGYLYLKAMLSKEKKDIEYAVTTIEQYYEGKRKTFRLLWFLIYMDNSYEENPEGLIGLLRDHFQSGNHSPILYFEACNLFNKHPNLLWQLDEFAIQVLHWGIQESFLSKETAMQYAYLAGKEKKYRNIFYWDLQELYEEYHTKEILTAICSLLIKGRKTGNQYFKWYEKGVEEKLRITELHEYYMYSIDERTMETLSHQILLYFMYESHLSDRKKAYLFANIIKNKQKDMATYRLYLKQIQAFTKKQILLHNINANLAVLYEDIVTVDFLEEEIAKHLPFVMFRQEIIVINSNIKGVYVVHKELEKEEYIPLVEQRAQVQIFTDNAQLFFEDEQSNRYYTTIPYTINKFVHLDDLAWSCYKLYKKNNLLLLNLFEKIDQYQKLEEEGIEIRKNIMEIHGIRKTYKQNSDIILIKYYYDNFETEQLDKHLANLKLASVDEKDRKIVMDYFIIRGFRERAIEAIRKYGFYGISVKSLLRFCLKELKQIETENQFQKKDGLLLNICYYLFQLHKQDELIIKYMLLFFEGATKDMLSLWELCKEYQLDCTLLEEKLLGQVLFTENFVISAAEVFCTYYKYGTNRTLIRAYLAYCAYQFLVHDMITPDMLFSIMKQEIEKEELEVCGMAVLKYLSTKKNLKEEEKQFAKTRIEESVKKEIILPFYKHFAGKITLPVGIANRYFIEYHANPKHIIKLCYRIEPMKEKEAFLTEVMKEVYKGIHVKSFILFYDEKIQYYISEQNESGEFITESVYLEPEMELAQEKENAYDLINFMLIAKELQDDKSLLETMKHYSKLFYTADNAFKIL